MGSIADSGTKFFFLQNVHFHSGAYTAFCSIAIEGSFRGDKAVWLRNQKRKIKMVRTCGKTAGRKNREKCVLGTHQKEEYLLESQERDGLMMLKIV